MYKWSSSFSFLPFKLNEIRNSLIVVAGASGSGKSAITTILAQNNPDLVIMKNYTTRKKRESDFIGHFSYLSEEQFFTLFNANFFFLSRLSPSPCYGYSVQQLTEVLSSNQKAILMFRYSGLKYLLESLGRLNVVFLEGDPELILRHSKRQDKLQSIDDVTEIIRLNRLLQKQMEINDNPFLCLTNNFKGVDELLTLSKEIDNFINDVN